MNNIDISFFIFKKGKDGFLYPVQNGSYLFGRIETLGENLEHVKQVIRTNFIMSQEWWRTKSTIESHKEFKDNYEILFTLTTKENEGGEK